MIQTVNQEPVVECAPAVPAKSITYFTGLGMGRFSVAYRQQIASATVAGTESWINSEMK